MMNYSRATEDSTVQAFVLRHDTVSYTGRIEGYIL